MIALADCNNFYASCERVFNPGLKNKPIVVLSNNDGCIIARSNEAKSLGIKMGEPVFKVRHVVQLGPDHVPKIDKQTLPFVYKFGLNLTPCSYVKNLT